MTTVLLQAAVWSGVVALAALGLSRVFRRDDADLWHAAWVSIAIGSIALPVAAALAPRALVLFVSESPAVAGAGALLRDAPMLRLAGVVYVLGAAALAWRLVAGLLLVRRLRRRSTALEVVGPGSMSALLAEIGGSGVAVRSHSRLQVPVTMGWRAPVVLLPESWRYWDAARLTAVLRHEIAHVAHRDYVWNVVASVFQVVFWFSPIAWVVVRRIRITAELAADRAAAAAMGSTTYARVLIQSARELRRAGSPGVLAPGAATALEARVAALVRLPDELPVPSGRRRRAAAAVVLAALLFGAAFRVGIVPPAEVPTDHEAVHLLRHRH